MGDIVWEVKNKFHSNFKAQNNEKAKQKMRMHDNEGDNKDGDGKTYI